MTLGWPELTALDAYRITEIPRRPGPGETGAPAGLPNDPGRTQRLAALIAAYHAGVGVKDDDVKDDDSGALALGWVRHRAGGPVQFLAAGPGLVGSQDDGEVWLTLPGGARAEPLARGALATLMAELPSWRAIGGLRLEAERRTGQRPPPSLEECLLAVWPRAFGWLLVAEPVGSAEIGALAEQVARQAESLPDEAHRLRLRHAELRQGLSTGLWRVRLAAGGADADAAARVAGLVCASADLAELPYAVAPADGDARGLPELMQDTGPVPAGGDAATGYPWYASTELVAALARPPEREIPGVRLALPPDFDVTQEPAAAGRDAIAVGEVLDRSRRPAGPLLLPLDSVNRHVFVCGATGAGKSQTVRALLESATRAGIPWLVVEPAKAEYRLMAARISGRISGLCLAGAAEVVRIRPGDPDAIAAGLNPLEPAPDAAGRRFPLQTHADLVTALFIASFRSQEPFGQVLSAALTRVYEDAGWDMALGETIAADANPGYPRLADLQRAAVEDPAGGRLRRADHRRRARVRQGAAVQPAPGHHRPVPGGRPSARLRPAAADQRRARARGRGRRRRQGVPHGRGAGPAGRAPADGAPGPAVRPGPAAPPHRHRGSPPAAAPPGRPRQRGRARGRAGSPACWPRSAPTARGSSSPSRSPSGWSRT